MATRIGEFRIGSGRPRSRLVSPTLARCVIVDAIGGGHGGVPAGPGQEYGIGDKVPNARSRSFTYLAFSVFALLAPHPIHVGRARATDHALCLVIRDGSNIFAAHE